MESIAELHNNLRVFQNKFVIRISTNEFFKILASRIPTKTEHIPNIVSTMIEGNDRISSQYTVPVSKLKGFENRKTRTLKGL